MSLAPTWPDPQRRCHGAARDQTTRGGLPASAAADLPDERGRADLAGAGDDLHEPVRFLKPLEQRPERRVAARRQGGRVAQHGE